MQLQQWVLFLAAIGLLLAAYAWRVWQCYQCFSSREPDTEAEQRAGRLLEEVLPERDRRRLAETGYLEIPSPSVEGRVYRVPMGRGKVEVHESGELRYRLCVEPVECLPRADVALMHKLMIEGDEAEYLRVANPLYVSPADVLAEWRGARRGLRGPY